MYKERKLTESNYGAIYYNGKTTRYHLDSSKPITELKYPEFFDVSISSKCFGKCDFCYQSNNECGKDHDFTSFINYLKGLTDNQKPFQMAIAGDEHDNFVKFLREIKNIGISPNYTTNGMWIDSDKKNDILNATKKYCQGVAVSCHSHLKEFWTKAAQTLIDNGVFTNFHNIVSDEKSVNEFIKIYEKWKDKIKYFVLLPLIKKGRSDKKMTSYNYLFSEIKCLKNKYGNVDNIAFSANLYEHLKENNYNWLPVKLYEPEIMSKYVDLKDGNIYKSSFNTDKPIGNIGDEKC